MATTPLAPREAVDTAHTGDIWLFRGRKVADRAVQLATNAPVNHVAMVVALDDLPPLLWHTELGRSIEDVWCGERHRGAQLNRLDESLALWTGRYGQRAFVRPLDGVVSRVMEDELLKVIDEYHATAFPRTRQLAWRWLSGRWRHDLPDDVVYCAELLGVTYARMGLVDEGRPANWYDPGRFWSGDHLKLDTGLSLGAEVPVGG